MKVNSTPLDGVVVIEPKVFRDGRGFFMETYNQGTLAAQGFEQTFVQDNHSLSSKGTIRGLHAQLHRPQGKLVRVTEGEIFDVAVDLRVDSATYRHWHGEILTADNFLQLYIPSGFGHGFSVLSSSAQVQYKCTELYHGDDEIALRWNDPSLGTNGTGIDWHLGEIEPVLSAKDQRAPLLSDLEETLRTAEAYQVG